MGYVFFIGTRKTRNASTALAQRSANVLGIGTALVEQFCSAGREVNSEPEVTTCLKQPRSSSCHLQWFATDDFPANTFIQCWTNVEDVGPTLYKCYTDVLCLLGYHLLCARNVRVSVNGHYSLKYFNNLQTFSLWDIEIYFVTLKFSFFSFLSFLFYFSCLLRHSIISHNYDTWIILINCRESTFVVSVFCILCRVVIHTNI